MTAWGTIRRHLALALRVDVPVALIVVGSPDAVKERMVRGWPNMLTVSRASKLWGAPVGAVVFLAATLDDMGWLNWHRPVVSDLRLRLRLVVAVGESLAGEAALRAPDFVSVAHWVEM